MNAPEAPPPTDPARRDAPRGRPESPPPVGSSFAGQSATNGGPGSGPPPRAEDLPPGLAENPDYEVLRELGRGGMGVVYLARNALMGRLEVLKVVSGHLLDRGMVRERFLREIRSAAQLHHPNIVTAYSAMRAGDRIVLAMEYVEGCDLSRLVRERGPLPVAHACHFAYQAALGLQHAHERGMVHRDIKPGNLMLARRGNRATVKILDFGLAKATQEAPVDGGLTREGQMLGTPDYIAPEQSLDAQKADIRADIYSLGCTLYCLLTGAPPFEAHSLYEILQSHHSREAMPLNLARPDVPAELAELVGKMMAKEAGRRFQTPGEVAQALRPYFRPGEAGSSTGARAADPPAGTIPRQAAPVAAAAVDQKGLARSGPPLDAIVLAREEDLSPDRPATMERTWAGSPWLWISAGSGVLLLCLVLARGLVVDAGREAEVPGRATPAGGARGGDRAAVDPAPHPPFGHLPGGEKGTVSAPAERDGRRGGPEPPSPRGEGRNEGARAVASAAEERKTGGIPSRSVAASPPDEDRRRIGETPVAAAPEPNRPGRGGSAPPAEPVAATARAGDRVEEKAPPPRRPGDLRQLLAFAGPFRPANPGAAPPRLGFWPIARPDDMTAWQVGDPGRVEMDRDGVYLSAGPGGNLLLTRREFRRTCVLKITLSARAGTEAFLALRAHRGPDGWRAITARVYDEGGRIRAGSQSIDFRPPERGTRLETFDPDDSFRITLQIDGRGVARLVANQKETSSIAYAKTPAGDYTGAVGVFVKSGALIIHAMDVQE